MAEKADYFLNSVTSVMGARRKSEMKGLK